MSAVDSPEHPLCSESCIKGLVTFERFSLIKNRTSVENWGYLYQITEWHIMNWDYWSYGFTLELNVDMLLYLILLDIYWKK